MPILKFFSESEIFFCSDSLLLMKPRERKNKKMKKLLVFMCAISLLFCLTVQTNAAVNETISPQWINTSRVECFISFSGTSGSITCKVIGQTATESIKGSLKLYKDNVEIDSWDIDERLAASISESFTGVSGCTYKLVLDVDVTRNGIVEPIEVESSKKCP